MSALKEHSRLFLARRAPDLLTQLYRWSRSRRFRSERQISTPEFIRNQYRDRAGRDLELDAPHGLSEKLNALKLMPATELQTRCADKIKVRDYVAKRVGDNILIPMILATYRLQDINPHTIRNDAFVIKTNHDFGGVLICRDRNFFDWTAARAKLADHLAFNHWYRHREPVYRDIQPGLLVEAFLQPDCDDGLREFKIFCFHGRPQFIMVIRERDGVRTKTVFDTQWRPLPVRRRGAPADPSSIPPPQSLQALLDTAEKLSTPFAFCRIDLYENFGRVRFGEITFFPEGGMDVFEPYEWELRFGDLLELPSSNGGTGAGARFE